jgi:hypothetical protein
VYLARSQTASHMPPLTGAQIKWQGFVFVLFPPLQKSQGHTTISAVFSLTSHRVPLPILSPKTQTVVRDPLLTGHLKPFVPGPGRIVRSRHDPYAVITRPKRTCTAGFPETIDCRRNIAMRFIQLPQLQAIALHALIATCSKRARPLLVILPAVFILDTALIPTGPVGQSRRRSKDRESNTDDGRPENCEGARRRNHNDFHSKYLHPFDIAYNCRSRLKGSRHRSRFFSVLPKSNLSNKKTAIGAWNLLTLSLEPFNLVEKNSDSSYFLSGGARQLNRNCHYYFTIIWFLLFGFVTITRFGSVGSEAYRCKP